MTDASAVRSYLAQLMYYFRHYGTVDNATAVHVADLCLELAVDVTDALPVTPELTTGLRKLLEARDCFVRAAVAWKPDEGR